MMKDKEFVAIENPYAPPVSQLLALGEPGDEKWCDYLALGIPMAAVPELIRMATDEVLNDGPQDSPIVWAPVHAWRALGQFHAAQAVEPLLSLLHRIDDGQDDWLSDDLPEVLALIGAAALDPAAKYLADAVHGEWARVAASMALGHIGCQHPELRAECVARLAKQLEQFAGQPERVNAYVISALWDLHAVEAMPVIGRAFASGLVDESVNGDWEDVQIHFGLKTEREHPRRPNPLLKMIRQIADLNEENEACQRENAELRETIAAVQALVPLITKTPSLLDDSEFEPSEPYVALPKVGRNEPCPCGSGRKYKKCCGA
jgi:hypothetical protein